MSGSKRARWQVPVPLTPPSERGREAVWLKERSEFSDNFCGSRGGGLAGQVVGGVEELVGGGGVVLRFVEEDEVGNLSEGGLDLFGAEAFAGEG